MNNEQHILHLLETVSDSQQELPERISAVKNIGQAGNPKMIDGLRKLFDRPRPSIEEMPINWDPVAAERVIDLYIIEALYKLGNDSELGRVQTLVRQAGKTLQGPDDELHNAASVILNIGLAQLIQQLIVLTTETDLQVISNAVKTLNQLNLPQPPVGGAVSSVFPSPKEFTFEIYTLKQELEALTRLSQGQIQLSTGVKEFLISNDYERGPVKRENVILLEVVERDLPILDFNYFVEENKVVICTYKEAGQRWQDWWRKYCNTLTYQKQSLRFVIGTQNAKDK